MRRLNRALDYAFAAVVNSWHWPFSTVNVWPKKKPFLRFLLKIVGFDTFLQSRFHSCCMCVFSFTWTQLSVVITAKFTTQFSEKQLRSPFQHWAAVHFGVWVPFQGYHCTEKTSSSKILSGLYYKSLSVKNYSAKANDGAIETFPSQRPFQGFLSLKQPRQYSSPTPHTLTVYIIYWWVTFVVSFSLHLFSKPTSFPLEIEAYNHGLLLE